MFNEEKLIQMRHKENFQEGQITLLFNLAIWYMSILVFPIWDYILIHKRMLISVVLESTMRRLI